MNFSLKKNKEEMKKRADLIAEINQVETVLLNLHQNLQLVQEDGLLDYYAYKIKSEEAKHQFLMNEIKQL